MSQDSQLTAVDPKKIELKHFWTITEVEVKGQLSTSLDEEDKNRDFSHLFPHCQ